MRGYCFLPWEVTLPLALGQWFIPPGCCRTCLEEAGSLGFSRELLLAAWWDRWEGGESGLPCHCSKVLGCSSPESLALERRPEKGRESLQSTYYHLTKKKKKKEEKRKCFSYLKSILELNRDVPDVLRDLMLIAIDFTGLWMGLFKAAEFQMNL